MGRRLKGRGSGPVVKPWARWSSTPRCSATRRSSPIPRTSGRSSPWPTRRSGTWARTRRTRSPRPHAVGMVVKEVSAEPSNWRARESLDAYLKRHGVAGISGIDTRKLVRHLRINGSQMGVISTEGTSAAALVERARTAERDGGAGPGHRHLHQGGLRLRPAHAERARREGRAGEAHALRDRRHRLRPQALHAAATWWTRAAGSRWSLRTPPRRRSSPASPRASSWPTAPATPRR